MNISVLSHLVIHGFSIQVYSLNCMSLFKQIYLSIVAQMYFILFTLCYSLYPIIKSMHYLSFYCHPNYNSSFILFSSVKSIGLNLYKPSYFIATFIIDSKYNCKISLVANVTFANSPNQDLNVDCYH